MHVLANAETMNDVRKANELGAEGLGLCRTEHMFFAEDRIEIMRAMILASNMYFYFYKCQQNLKQIISSST
jgi:pyruvate,orthophosphate dikinase